MAKRKTPPKKTPPQEKVTCVGMQKNDMPDYEAAGKHLAAAIVSFSKAMKAVSPDKPITYTTSWIST